MQPPSDLTWLNFGVFWKAHLNVMEMTITRLSHYYHTGVTWPSHGCQMTNITTVTCLSHDHYMVVTITITVIWLSHDHHNNSHLINSSEGKHFMSHLIVTWPSHDHEMLNQQLTQGESSVVPSLVRTLLPSPAPCLSTGRGEGSWTHWGQRSHLPWCLWMKCWTSCHQEEDLGGKTAITLL